MLSSQNMIYIPPPPPSILPLRKETLQLASGLSQKINRGCHCKSWKDTAHTSPHTPPYMYVSRYKCTSRSLLPGYALSLSFSFFETLSLSDSSFEALSLSNSSFEALSLSDSSFEPWGSVSLWLLLWGSVSLTPALRLCLSICLLL